MCLLKSTILKVFLILEKSEWFRKEQNNSTADTFIWVTKVNHFRKVSTRRASLLRSCPNELYGALFTFAIAVELFFVSMEN